MYFQYPSSRGFSFERELTAPLVSADSEVAYDEESLHERWFNSTSSFSDDDDTPDDKLKKKYRVHRKYLNLVFSKPGAILDLIMFLTYIIVVALVVVDVINQDPSKEIIFFYVAVVCVIIWEIAIDIPLYAYLWGGRQGFAWGGLYVILLSLVLQAGTLVFFLTSFAVEAKDSWHLPKILLILLAFTTYVEQKIVKPSFRKLSWCYRGAITKEEAREKPPPISGISSIILQKAARNACKAVGISDEAAETIEQLLEGQRIRKEEEEAIDDWVLTINKITKSVSFAPFSPCRSNAAITSTQCQNLVCQMIIYLRQFMADGHIEADEADLNRTVPLSFAEAFWAMTMFSCQVPLSFFMALIPRSIFGALMAAVVPTYVQNFTNGIYFGNIPMAVHALTAFMIISAVAPLLMTVGNLLESSFTTKAIDLCRRKMLRSMLKGGTKFDEKNRPGTLGDAFSNQLNAVEMYCMQFYIQIVPQIFTVFSAIGLAAKLYPLAVIIFISLVPVILSVDYFEARASKVAHKAVKNDAAFAGKIASAITCRKAIRACDASDYIKNDMEDLLASTKNTHFSRFFRSILTENFVQFSAAFLNITILAPTGIMVINGEMDVGAFIAISMALQHLVQPITMLGYASSQTLQFSGAIQVVKDLMGDSLDEESPSDQSSGDKIELQSLKNSLDMAGIKFRYNAKQPDVLSNVETSIGKGTYSVICGESGSGKTTVLNLLMRFRKPYEGSIEWDGTNIFDTSLQSFRKQVSVMFQETMIYQTTIRENITFGLPEVPGAVEKAARDAEIADVIERLPDKYETIVGGDSLAGLSGGQQQRICMARALYKKPSVLLLDEATSALDAETEASIIETLVNLRDNEGLTLVSVSHHPSTAVKADKIVVMRAGGTVAEEGVYDDLVSRENGIFKRMVEAA